MKKKKDLLKLHDMVVKKVLDDTDIPFAIVRRFWFKNGDFFRGHRLKIHQNKEMLISSYIEIDGHTIRISNHEKKAGYPDGMTNYIYDDDGTIIKCANYPKVNKKNETNNDI